MRQSTLVPKKEMKVRVHAKSGLARFVLGPVGRFLVIAAALFTIAVAGVFMYFYAQYSRVVAERLHVPFANTAKIYAMAESVAVGDALSPADIAAGCAAAATPNRIQSHGLLPGSSGQHRNLPRAGFLFRSGGRRHQIRRRQDLANRLLQDNTERPEYQLEPQLITNVSGASREKRRMVKFRDIPPVLVQAVTSIEDKRFFQHNGFDPIRIVKAAYTDLREGRKDQGASTLSQQLARMFWLGQEKRWTRKLAEMIITVQIEQSLSKEEIFEDYANDVPHGVAGRI